MDDDAAFGAQEGFVVGGVVQVTGEAGVVPKQDGDRAVFFAASIGDHAVEVFTPGGGGARFGDIFVDMAQFEVVPGAIGLYRFELA